MIDNIFNKLKETTSDINEHMETLRVLSTECSNITEMGVRRCVSTWAFIEGLKSGKLVSIDIKHPEDWGGNLKQVKKACKKKNIDFTFILGNTLDIVIDDTELLFIDTQHTYKQLSQELALHSSKVRKFIILHDTVSFPGLWQAVEEFIQLGVWEIKSHYTNNNGLTILERRQ